MTYVLLATLVGIGYGAGYHLTGRVEVSILVHFTLNLARLLLFTYPFTAQGGGGQHSASALGRGRP